MSRSRRGSGPRRLAALVVGGGSGAFALRCAESLVREWTREGGAAEALEIVACDPREAESEASWWRSLEHLGARVLRCADAPGDTARVARALGELRGAADAPVLLAAPDLYFAPGCLGPLLAALEAPRAGLAAPRAFLDETLQLALPRPEQRTLCERALGRVARAAPAFGPLRDAARLERLGARWSEAPLEPLAAAPGGCLLTRRSWLAAAASGGGARTLEALESALAHALRRGGRELLEAREARALHHGSRWPGLGLPERAPRVPAGLYRLAGAAPRELRGFRGFDLGPVGEPPTFALARLAHFWIELAPAAAPRRAGGILGAGASYAFPHRAWSWLPAGRYLARAIDRRSGAILGRWRFEKTAPARSWPLDPAAVAHLEPRRARVPGWRAEG